MPHYHDYEYPNCHKEMMLRSENRSATSKQKSLQEVLLEPEVVIGAKWFRPVSWEGCKSAYEIRKDQHIYAVPSMGAVRMFTTSSVLLMGNWESVTPSQVLNGD